MSNIKENDSNNITISKDIEHLVLESQKILLEFFTINSQNFDSNKINRMKEIFSTFSVVYISPDEAQRPRLKAARCNHDTKTIEINKENRLYCGSRGMTKEFQIMAQIIHEYGHAFTGITDQYSGVTEEGMVICLEEKVMDYYFKTRGIFAEHENVGYTCSMKSFSKTLETCFIKKGVKNEEK